MPLQLRGLPPLTGGETSTDYLFAQGGYRHTDEGSLYVIRMEDVDPIGNLPRGWGKIKPGTKPFVEIRGTTFHSWVPEGDPEDPYGYLIKNYPELMARQN